MAVEKSLASTFKISMKLNKIQSRRGAGIPALCWRAVTSFQFFLLSASVFHDGIRQS